MEALTVLAAVVGLVFVTFGIFAFSHAGKFDDLMKGPGDSPQPEVAASPQLAHADGRCLLCQTPLARRSPVTSDEVVWQVEQRIVADREAVKVYLQ